MAHRQWSPLSAFPHARILKKNCPGGCALMPKGSNNHEWTFDRFLPACTHDLTCFGRLVEAVEGWDLYMCAIWPSLYRLYMFDRLAWLPPISNSNEPLQIIQVPKSHPQLLHTGRGELRLWHILLPLGGYLPLGQVAATHLQPWNRAEAVKVSQLSHTRWCPQDN